MDVLNFLPLLLPALVSCLGQNKNDDSSAMGVVSDWTPQEIDVKDTVWWWFEKSIKWTAPLVDNMIEMECFEYYLGKDARGTLQHVYVIEIRTEIEKHTIEHFIVDSCLPRLQSFLQLQATDTKARNNGYDFTLRFKESHEICYERKYTISTTDIRAKLRRDDVGKIACTTELDHEEESKVKILIKGWSSKGTYDISYCALDYRYSHNSMRLYNCGPEEAFVYCYEHHNLPLQGSDYILVADIVVNKVRIDRLKVTSCTDLSLSASFHCKRHHCLGHHCYTDILFMKQDGFCVKRKYTTLKLISQHYKTVLNLQEGFEFSPIDYTVEKGPMRGSDCETHMTFKGFFRMIGRKLRPNKRRP